MANDSDQTPQLLVAQPATSEALRTQLEQLKRALAVTGIGAFVYDARTDAVWGDQVTYALHGRTYSGEALSSESLLSLIPRRDAKTFRVQLAQARSANEPFNAGYRTRLADGSDRWIEVRGYWEQDDQGRAVLLRGLCYDVSDRAMIEARLATSETRLREAQSAGRVGSWEIDVETMDVSVSEEFARAHGVSERSFPLQAALELIAEPDFQTMTEALASTHESGGLFDMEYCLRHGDTGELRWMHGRGSGIFEGDRLVRIAGTSHDVTERNYAQQAALERARDFQALAQASPALIFRTDEFGAATYFNDDRWTEFSGLSADAWRDGGWWAAFHPSDRDRVRQTWEGAVARREPFEAECRWLVGDDVRWILLHAHPVFDLGKLSGYVGTGTNISALKSSERQRASLKLALAESQKLEAIGTLASGVAHDFNNMLAAIQGYVELAKLEMEGESARRYLTRAEEAIDQATDVTARLLAFSRGGSPDRSPLHLVDVVADSLLFIRQLLPASVNIGSSLNDGDIWVSGDATQLRQVLINLVINARDAILARNGRGQIDVGLDVAGGMVQITIRDNGIGMDEATRKRVFEPFFTTKDYGHGTGLGLSVVHGIINAHGGEISIESTPGVGTEARVLLPTTLERPEHVAGARPRALTRSGRKVLFVEDNPLVRESCAFRMEASGYEVVSAEDGETALALLEDSTEAPALALVDVDLPGLNGVEVAEALRAFEPDLGVIFVTGNPQNEVLVGASSADPVVLKPLDYEQLFDAMEQVAAG